MTTALETITPWPPLLPIDLALGLDDIPVILARHGLTEKDYTQLADLPAFRLELMKISKEIRENGLSFARKSAYQAESYLEDLDLLMQNVDTPPSIKLDIFKTLAKMGGLEPKDAKADGNGAPSFNLQINIG
jgi:hypothetical protein